MKSQRMAYTLFLLVFVIVIVGMLLHSILWLTLAVVVAIALATVADRWENRLSKARRPDRTDQ